MVRIDVPVAFFAFVSLVSATPVEHAPGIVRVPISRKVGTRIAAELVTREKDRVVSFARSATGSQPVMNQDLAYIASTVVGTQTFNLIVDTGSSNTWVGAGYTQYALSSSGTQTGRSVSVTYRSGAYFSGQEYTDKVTLGGLTVTKQSIGVASSTSYQTGINGKLGLGPVDLTEGTVSGLTTVPTFMDNLFSQGSITAEVLGVYFSPEIGSDTADLNGELTFGGVDASKYTGTLSYFPRSTTSPYSRYWGVTVASVTYGSTSLATSAQAIVDTGTLLIYIPTSAYNSFLAASGGILDSSTGLTRFTTMPAGDFTFTLGSVSYPLTPAQYIITSAQSAVLGLATPYYYSWIADGGSVAVNINFIIGQKWLENYYSVFDTANSRVGFATRT